MIKEILGVIAIIITFYSFYPYIKSICRGETQPHVFSWVVWGLTTIIVFFAQLSDDGGAGAWSIGVSGVLTCFVALLAYQKKTDLSIKKLDWVFFILALLAIPFWFFTSNAMWAIIILTTVDVLGFGPTLRNSYHNPHSEQVLFYFLFTLRNAISIFALYHFSLITALFPIATGVGCLILILVIVVRRKVIPAPVK